MITTPQSPDHAPTRRKITEPGPEWLHGKWVAPVMKGIGRPSLTFTILITAVLFFAVVYRAGTLVTEPVG